MPESLKGGVAGSSLMFGTFNTQHFVLRLDANMFRPVLAGIMIASGIAMLTNALLERANGSGGLRSPLNSGRKSRGRP
jgi:hypothetical protein